MQRLGAQVVEAAAVIDLPALGGSRRLDEAGMRHFSLLKF
jgi:adenine phosphoribosyltransferase